MKAVARIVAESDGHGRTRLAVLRGESPLLLRRTGPRSPDGTITVHLVGGAAGPLCGDELRLDIEVGPDAHLDVHSVAASLAMPGRPGAPASELTVTAAVGPGATLRYTPEPLIAVAGCDHLTRTTVDVADGGTLLWRDDLVCGRHDEPAGDVRTRTTIRYAGHTLYRHDLAVGPHAPGWAGPAVLGEATAAGGGRAIGSVIVAGPSLPAPGLLGADGAAMQLAGPGILATAIGTDIRAVQAVLDPFCAAFRTTLPATAPA